MKPVEPPDPPTLPFSQDTSPTVDVPAHASGEIVADDATQVSGVYEIGEVLGRGGMGEVLLAHDRRIGRDVALKRLHHAEPAPDDIARFLREARIQARLDHPAIVPVYEVARDGAGRHYFTMKRVSGQTLAAVLAAGAPQHRLLRAFADVCRAIDFAHSRGVVHRDLKPANIVLGEFGEVYVIDWGIAFVTKSGARLATADTDTLEGAAPPGKALGTPGYSAPEQLSNPEVTAAADVYALGAILFEILAGESLHPRSKPAAIRSTLEGMTVLSPALRSPDRDVGPELDALCVAMLGGEPTRRPTARRCADQIEEFLDGDRDLANRRTMARDLVELARSSLARHDHVGAMRMAGRALALDPQTESAAEIVTTVMLRPPVDPPPELRVELVRADQADISRHAKAAIPGYVLIFAFLPLAMLTGIHSYLVLGTIAASSLGMAWAAYRLMTNPDRSLEWMIVYAIGNAVVVGLLARIASPLAIVPALASFITASVVTYPVFLQRPLILVGIMLGSFVVPLVFVWTGAWPASIVRLDGGIAIADDAMALGSRLSVALIVLGSAATIVMAGIQSVVLGRAKRAAQHELVSQAWHLQQLLPK